MWLNWLNSHSDHFCPLPPPSCVTFSAHLSRCVSSNVTQSFVYIFFFFLLFILKYFQLLISFILGTQSRKVKTLPFEGSALGPWEKQKGAGGDIFNLTTEPVNCCCQCFRKDNTLTAPLLRESVSVCLSIVCVCVCVFVQRQCQCFFQFKVQSMNLYYRDRDTESLWNAE